MKTNVTSEQIESYNENGFLVVENFLSAEELDHWRTQTAEAVQQRLEKRNGYTNQGGADSYYQSVFVQCVKLADSHEGVRKFIYDRELGKMAATLAGVEGIRIWHDQALFKQPYGNPTGWHLDNPYWSFSSKQSISIWVALDDATLANGCMWYLPGTHKTARYDNHGIGANLAGLFKIYPEWLEIDSVAAPAKAGTAVFHNGLCAHGAGANMTNKPRRAMTCAYMPDGSTFNGTKNILPEEYFKSLKIGDVLNNDEVNPLIWSKARDKAQAKELVAK
jgi:phytanoyl-CoA hydroxylase